MPPLLFAALAAGVSVSAFGVSLRYRRDLQAAGARLAAVDHVDLELGSPSRARFR